MDLLIFLLQCGTHKCSDYVAFTLVFFAALRSHLSYTTTPLCHCSSLLVFSTGTPKEILETFSEKHVSIGEHYTRQFLMNSGELQLLMIWHKVSLKLSVWNNLKLLFLFISVTTYSLSAFPSLRSEIPFPLNYINSFFSHRVKKQVLFSLYLTFAFLFLLQRGAGWF